MKRRFGQFLWAALACALCYLPFAARAAEMEMHHSFHDAAKWARMFDDPQRDAWQKPHEVIQALALKPGERVADLGAGTGYFTVRLAHMLPQGRVYAVDTEPDMVRYVADRAKKAGLANVKTVLATANDARLPEKVDLILLVDVYHHIGDRTRYFSRLGESLGPDGRIAIIDYRMDAPEGPPPGMRVKPAQVDKQMRDAGYVPAGEHDFLPYQYFLVFRRPAAR